jgi:ribosomal protein S18 acetylase RimI-like enzyme
MNTLTVVRIRKFSVLTFLGKRFLYLFYRGVIHYDKTIKLVYLHDDEVQGFVIGSISPSGFYSALLKRDWLLFGLASIPAVLKKPRSLLRLLRAFTKASSAPKDSWIAELSSIAVLPDSQGKGLGKELVSAFIQEVKKRGSRAIYLTTDADNNEPVNHFYKKIGFRIKRVIVTPENRRMNEFWIEIE